jgi:hypothetical protein
MIASCKNGRIAEELVAAYFGVLFQNFNGKHDKTHKNLSQHYGQHEQLVTIRHTLQSLPPQAVWCSAKKYCNQTASSLPKVLIGDKKVCEVLISFARVTPHSPCPYGGWAVSESAAV